MADRKKLNSLHLYWLTIVGAPCNRPRPTVPSGRASKGSQIGYSLRWGSGHYADPLTRGNWIAQVWGIVPWEFDSRVDCGSRSLLHEYQSSISLSDQCSMVRKNVPFPLWNKETIGQQEHILDDIGCFIGRRENARLSGELSPREGMRWSWGMVQQSRIE